MHAAAPWRVLVVTVGTAAPAPPWVNLDSALRKGRWHCIGVIASHVCEEVRRRGHSSVDGRARAASVVAGVATVILVLAGIIITATCVCKGWQAFCIHSPHVHSDKLWLLLCLVTLLSGKLLCAHGLQASQVLLLLCQVHGRRAGPSLILYVCMALWRQWRP